MNAYESFLRDCAFNARRFEREPLTRPELAMLMEQFTDLFDEAMADVPDSLVKLYLRENQPEALGALMVVTLREKAMAYIATDLRRARLDHEEETRIDMRFNA